MLLSVVLATLISAINAEEANWCPKGGCWEKPSKCHYDPCEKLCGAPAGDLFIVEQEISYKEAHKVCNQYGGVLASLDNKNFVEATTDAFRCTGAFSETWVRAFDQDSHHAECLVLTTGVAAPGGAMNVPVSCHKRRYTLCSRTQPDHEWVAPHRPHKPRKPHNHNHHHHHPSKPPRHHCCHQGCNCNCLDKPLFHYRGDHVPDVSLNGTFYYPFWYPNYVANDGNLTIENGFLKLDSQVYTIFSTHTWDHAKLVLQSSEIFNLPEHGEMSFSARVKSNSTFGNYTQYASQILDPTSDFRLASFTFFVTDPITGLFFSFVKTNGQIYAVTDRASTIPNAVQGFGSAISVGTSDPYQEHDLKLLFDAERRTVRWILDDKLVHQLGYAGIGTMLSPQYTFARFAGTASNIYPSRLGLGFGNIDYLNAYGPCNVRIQAPDGGTTCATPVAESGLAQLESFSTYVNPRTGLTPADWVVPIQGHKGCIVSETKA
jgi:hypothetical protein